MTSNASEYGVEAMISHIFPNMIARRSLLMEKSIDNRWTKLQDAMGKLLSFYFAHMRRIFLIFIDYTVGMLEMDNSFHIVIIFK